AANACTVSEETVNECVEISSPAEDLAAAADASEAEKEEGNDLRRIHSLDKDGLIAEIKEILAQDRMEAHKEVTALKQAFFSIKTKENLEQLNAFIDEGNDPAAFSSPVDEKENEFKTLYTEFKEKRAAFIQADEQKRKENLEKKREILEKLRNITEDIDNVNVRFPEFQQLVQDFKAVKEIPASDESDVWKQFQIVTEQFYDHLKMNKELRDLDFKKNLEAKKALIEEAKRLEENADPIAAFRSLQNIHEAWRNIGPVAKDIREALWEEFKAASAVINRRHQDYFEQRKAAELANEEAKTKLCEEIEAIDLSALNSFNDWNATTDKVIDLQKRWKEYGFAPKKSNTLLYARFREACDKFFNAKTEYFQKTKEEIASNLDKKTKLCEKAEALKGTDDIRKATAEVVKLQAEWKKIGSVPRKYSDAIWERFQTACNYFFDERKRQESARREVENANLEKKRAIIEELKLLPKDGDRREVIGRVKELQAAWQEAGFVPFKLKDKIYAEYRAVCDELYGAYDSREKKARMNNFQERVASLKNEGQNLNRERERLVRVLEAKRNDMKTIENNMGFFNVKSSAGNSMVKEMERKINRLKEEIKQVEEKIAILDKGE
ncbi:MAG: DUF349 domain-containing protein, partial [Muribaculaceae bacterium]|nr:DUF349 domain-containing protein [Muribaculaceae bacterium]